MKNNWIKFLKKGDELELKPDADLIFRSLEDNVIYKLGYFPLLEDKSKRIVYYCSQGVEDSGHGENIHVSYVTNDDIESYFIYTDCFIIPKLYKFTNIREGVQL